MEWAAAHTLLPDLPIDPVWSMSLVVQQRHASRIVCKKLCACGRRHWGKLFFHQKDPGPTLWYLIGVDNRDIVRLGQQFARVILDARFNRTRCRAERERLQAFEQPKDRYRRICGDAKGGRGRRPNLGQCTLKIIERHRDWISQLSPCLCRCQAACAALEQLRAEPVFQLLYALADSRLRDIELRRGGAKTTCTQRGFKKHQRIKRRQGLSAAIHSQWL
ncbi:hypothetical protein SAMN05443432_1194 [Roseovarius litoreus]|uniref:Transposase n=1 Tax=Roseovarius litoreus TaxID=1155722 RepID=A0A1M7LNG4_9RHOB|nr:hypothetical protein SAMN05443432_1194 [Roseovarius litoreus]